MNKVRELILEIEALKVNAHKGNIILDETQKKYIFEKKIGELNHKMDAVQEEITKSIGDLFDYLNMKQASIETLNNLYEYLEREKQIAEKQLRELKMASK